MSSLYSGNYEFFPFGDDQGPSAAQWALWNTTTPLTLSFPSNLSIASVWFPTLSNAVSLYYGPTATGTPFHVTSAAGSELVPIPPGVLSVTISSPTGIMPVFWSSRAFDPTKLGPLGAFLSSVTVTYPLQSTGGQNPVLSLAVPLAVEFGGSGSTGPSLIAGTNISISGVWPNQTISAEGSSAVSSVTASLPLASSGGTDPNITMEIPLPQAYGGTGTSSPADTAGAGIAISGAFGNETITNTGVISLEGTNGAVTVTPVGGIAVSGSGNTLTLDVSSLLASATSTDGTITITRTGQNIDIATSSKIPVTQQGAATVNMAGAPTSSGSTTVTIPLPYSGTGDYFVLITLLGGAGQATITPYVNKLSGSQFSVTLEGDATHADTITINWLTIKA